MDFDPTTITTAVPIASAIGGLLWRIGSKIVDATTSLDANTKAISGLHKMLVLERDERIAADHATNKRIDDTYRHWPPPIDRSVDE